MQCVQKWVNVTQVWWLKTPPLSSNTTQHAAANTTKLFWTIYLALLHLIFQADEFCIMSLIFKDWKTYFGVKTPNKKEENWNWLWIYISALPPIPYASCFFSISWLSWLTNQMLRVWESESLRQCTETNWEKGRVQQSNLSFSQAVPSTRYQVLYAEWRSLWPRCWNKLRRWRDEAGSELHCLHLGPQMSAPPNSNSTDCCCSCCFPFIPCLMQKLTSLVS